MLYLVIIYASIVAFMYFYQRKLIFYPERSAVSLEHYSLPGFEETFLTAEDGVRLQAWYSPARAGFATLIYFHGNAGHLGYRDERFRTFAASGLGVLALSYRGYGASEGLPDEEGLYRDGRAAIHFLLQNQGLNHSNIILFGESLGSGVAIQLAKEMAKKNTPVRQIILQSPYLSLVHIGREQYPYIPVRWLLKHRFESYQKIDDIGTSLLIFHGVQDRLVPIHHGRELFALAKEPKRLYELEDAGHNYIPTGLIIERMREFNKDIGLIAPPANGTP